MQTQKPVLSKPNLFNFLDALQFLQAYFQYRKSSESGFSYEAWAAELGFKSRSSLRMVLLGQKKISLGFCKAFCDFNSLNEKEEEYLHCLVSYSQAGTPRDKKIYGAKLVQIIKTVSQRTEIENQVDFVAKPLYVRLLTLLGFEDVESTPENLAELLFVETSEIRESLKKLEDLGLASMKALENKEYWMTTHERFRVPDNMGSVPMMRFHEQSLLESIQAFHKPKEERRYKSLLLPLSKEELTEFHSLMDNFAAEQLARFQANQYKGRRLYQVNLNVHTVAQETSE